MQLIIHMTHSMNSRRFEGSRMPVLSRSTADHPHSPLCIYFLRSTLCILSNRQDWSRTICPPMGMDKTDRGPKSLLHHKVLLITICNV